MPYEAWKKGEIQNSSCSQQKPSYFQQSSYQRLGHQQQSTWDFQPFISSASQEVAKLKRLEKSYAEVLRLGPQKCNNRSIPTNGHRKWKYSWQRCLYFVTIIINNFSEEVISEMFVLWPWKDTSYKNFLNHKPNKMELWFWGSAKCSLIPHAETTMVCGFLKSCIQPCSYGTCIWTLVDGVLQICLLGL